MHSHLIAPALCGQWECRMQHKLPPLLNSSSCPSNSTCATVPNHPQAVTTSAWEPCMRKAPDGPPFHRTEHLQGMDGLVGAKFMGLPDTRPMEMPLSVRSAAEPCADARTHRTLREDEEGVCNGAAPQRHTLQPASLRKRALLCLRANLLCSRTMSALGEWFT